MRLQQQRVPVTALHFWNHDIVLAGEGVYLTAYHVRTHTIICRLALFEGQQIHGIVVHNEHDSAFALVWGRRLICRVDIEPDGDSSVALHGGQIHQACDWILDVAFAPTTGHQNTIAGIVTAHNSLTLWNPVKDKHLILDPLVPGSNCILYSAHIKWLSPSKCLIAAGTAFGDVIVWSCPVSVESIGVATKPRTHYVFSAHEGSVFGVHISSDDIAAAFDGRQHILASCSDDRTVRIWDVSDLLAESPTLNDLQRETGFGAKQAENDYAPTCLGKVMAHASRIWHVSFSLVQVPNDYRPFRKHDLARIRISSLGEDASYITWRLRRSDHPRDACLYLLGQCNRQKVHHGKNIWSVAVNSANEVVTGGADGAVITSNLLRDSINEGNQFEAGPLLCQGLNAGDSFRAFGFDGPSRLIGTTQQGRVLRTDLSDATNAAVDEISPSLDGLRGYSVTSNCSSATFIAGTDGAVNMCLPGAMNMISILRTNAKVAGVFSHVMEEMNDGFRKFALLTVNVGSAIATLLVFMCNPKDTETSAVVEIQRQDLKLHPGFTTTSFVTWTSENRDYAVLGSRDGTISFCSISSAQHGQTAPGVSFSNIHMKEAITNLHLATRLEANHDFDMLFSTGRDGTYAVHTLCLEDGSVALKTIHQLSLPFGPNIEGIGYSLSNHVWVWGFRSTHFVVFDINTEQEVFTVECGGAHRNWAFQMQGEGGMFVWTKASKLYCERRAGPSAVAIKAGTHGRDINAVAVSSASPCIIATGSEDTTIRLSIYAATGFRDLCVLRKHNTGIQHLQWSADARYLFSSGGFEELCVWRITPAQPAVRIGCTCESLHPSSGSSDLRITTFLATPSDTRPDVFRIVALYSDSSIKCWQYAGSTRQWDLLAAGDYLAACPTQCVDWHGAGGHSSEAAGGNAGLVSASTDGHLVSWRAPAESGRISWRSRQRVHQNAILSLATHRLGDGSLLVFSGGDDNAVAVTRLCAHDDDDDDKDNGARSAPARTLTILRAHAAAVTGLAVIPDKRRENGVWLVSAGIDQRLKLWRVDVDVRQLGARGVQIARRANVFTAVADVSVIERIPLDGDGAEGVLVAGVGVDVWELDSLDC